MHRYRKSKFNKFLTIIALSLTFFVTIGYARLKETLTITSSAKFSPIPVLKATYYGDTDAFRSDTYKTKIKTITFEDKINVPDSAIESWDVSEQQNGAYMAYVVPNETDSTYYDLHIQGDGKIYANEDMSYWFANLTYVDSINNLKLLDTEKTTDMSNMFNKSGYNSTIFTLDLSNFYTSNVTNMAYMFSWTGRNSTLFSLDLNNFDTSNVTDMSWMFVGTGGLNTRFTLDIGNFDTSNVIDMSYMFASTGYSSTILTLDVSNFNTKNVTNMKSMFEETGCSNPEFTLDLSRFDTSKVTDMSQMFYSTGYNSTKLNTSITIRNPNIIEYTDMFRETALKAGAQITVNYTSETSDLVDAMIATKSELSNVVKGIQVD